MRTGTAPAAPAALLLCVLAADAAAQSVFVVEQDAAGERVLELDGGAPSTRFVLPPAYQHVQDVAADAEGQVYLSLERGPDLYDLVRVDPAGVAETLVAGLGFTEGLHVDAEGALHFVHTFTDVYRIDPSGTELLYSTTIETVRHLATDPFGTLLLGIPEQLPFVVGGRVLRLRTLGITEAFTVHVPPAGHQLRGLDVGPCGRLVVHERGAAGSRLVAVGPSGSTAVLFSVAAPAVLGGHHRADGAGTLYAVVDPQASGAGPRIVAVTGGVATTLYQSTTGTLTGLAFHAPACAQPTHATGSAGATAGGPFDVLTVNGSAGGALRRVTAGAGLPVTVAVAPPATAGGSATFTLFGLVGGTDPTGVVVGPPGLGDLAFTPCPLDPADPLLFTLADGFGIGGCTAALPVTPAPWSASLPMPTFPFTFVVQGVIEDPSSPFQGLAVTNAVLLRVGP